MNRWSPSTPAALMLKTPTQCLVNKKCMSLDVSTVKLSLPGMTPLRRGCEQPPEGLGPSDTPPSTTEEPPIPPPPNIPPAPPANELEPPPPSLAASPEPPPPPC